MVEVWQGLALDELACRQVGRSTEQAPACKVGGGKDQQRLQNGEKRGINVLHCACDGSAGSS